MSIVNWITNLKKIRLAIAGAACLALSGCMTQDKSDDVKAPEKGMVFAVTSDYKTGSYGAFGLDSAFTLKDIAPIFSDAVVRYAGGDDIFVLNRMGRDNLQVIDRHNLKTVMQVPFPALSNPYDVAVKDSLLYVAFYGYPKIGIYQQSDGKLKDEIDLSAYADTSDHLPETTQLMFVGNKLYALLANLDTKNKYVPLTAKLAKIDPAGKSVEALDLPFGNPVSMAYDSSSNKLYIPCRGAFFNADYTLDLDGGIVGINLGSFAVTDTVATEVSLGGSLNAILFHDGKFYMDLSASDAGTPIEKVVAINLKDGKTSSLMQTDGYGIGGMAIDEKTGTLCVGDRTNGLRLFDLSTSQEKSGSKISLGLPISDLVVVR